MISTSTAPSLALAWSSAVDGKVTAQPLYAKGVEVAGALHDVVLVGTAANSLSALDLTTGATLWRRSFGVQPTNCAIPGDFGVVMERARKHSSGLVELARAERHRIALIPGHASSGS